MSMYIADFSYDIREWDVVTIEADGISQAEEFVMEHIREAYPDVNDIEIESLKEVV